MTVEIADLGVQSRGDTWCNWRCARHPRSAAPLALGSLANNGFMLIDPAAGTGVQVIPSKRFTSGWAIGQAPDGSIYQAGFSSDNTPNMLVRWNWEGETSEPVVTLPAKAVFTLDIGSDGTVFMPDYSRNTIFMWRPGQTEVGDLGCLKEFGNHVRVVYCGADGLVYATCTDYRDTRIVAINPATGKAKVVMPVSDGKDGWQTGQLLKDAGGRVLVPAGDKDFKIWYELRDGLAHKLDLRDPVAMLFGGDAKEPLVFSDGSYIAAIADDTRKATVTAVDADGSKRTFEVARRNPPLRIFGLAAGASRIWGGTFIPLTLFAHDTATGQSEAYGNPTATGGEIYSMLESGGRVYMASYTGATLTRFDPALSWNPGKDADANPRHLGLMKEDGPALHRPYGKTVDDKGRLFFSAKGDYGCIDSGICRIDPRTENVTRWIYPRTSISAMVFLPSERRIMVCERQSGDNLMTATFVCPESGRVLERSPLIEDQGEVHSWLHAAGEDLVYGLHGYRAALFAFSIKEKRVVATLPDVGAGTHCHECLLFGPDGDIWCLTVDGVFSVTRDLKSQGTVALYEDRAGKNHYRFGMVQGSDGGIYFPNGQHLMRLRKTD